MLEKSNCGGILVISTARGRAVAARQAHNLKVNGSIPFPATIFSAQKCRKSNWKNGQVTSLCKICANPERSSNDSPPCQITTDHNDPIREELPCQSKSEAKSSITVLWLPESAIPASVKAVKFRQELLRGKLPLSKSVKVNISSDKTRNRCYIEMHQ